MRRFLRNPEGSLDKGNSLLSDLISGWGNTAWSAKEEYLKACIKHALEARGPILECGSGLTTLLVGGIATSRGNAYWALEHTPEWADRVERFLDEFSLRQVTLDAKPLRDYGDYSWYDPSFESMPDSFDLVICDGPPGSTKGGRSGLVPVMRSKLRKGCIVLLDDASREEEIRVAQKWEVELQASARLCGDAAQHIELVVGASKGE